MGIDLGEAGPKCADFPVKADNPERPLDQAGFSSWPWEVGPVTEPTQGLGCRDTALETPPLGAGSSQHPVFPCRASWGGGRCRGHSGRGGAGLCPPESLEVPGDQKTQTSHPRSPQGSGKQTQGCWSGSGRLAEARLTSPWPPSKV